MDNSKQIDEQFLDIKPSMRTRFSIWIDEHNPFPYRVRFWFNDQDIFHPSRILRKLSNIVRWVPILWNDVDWDYASLYVLMYSKIRFMRDHHEECHHHTDWIEVVGQMQTAEDCLRRLCKDDYAMDVWESHYAQFPRTDKLINLSNGHRQVVSMSDEERVSFFKCADKEEELRQSDLSTFASIFVKHVRGWWD